MNWLGKPAVFAEDKSRQSMKKERRTSMTRIGHISSTGSWEIGIYGFMLKTHRKPHNYNLPGQALLWSWTQIIWHFLHPKPELMKCPNVRWPPHVHCLIRFYISRHGWFSPGWKMGVKGQETSSGPLWRHGWYLLQHHLVWRKQYRF